MKFKFEILLLDMSLGFGSINIKLNYQFQHAIFPPICLLSAQVRIQNLSIWHWKYLCNIKNERDLNIRNRYCMQERLAFIGCISTHSSLIYM
jgi:hypothetical protein